MTKNRKATVLAVPAVVAVVIGLGGTVAFKSIQANLKQLAGLAIRDVDLSGVADGTYRGGYRQFPVSAELEVTVQDHTITGIVLLEHRHGRGAAAESIPGTVVREQTLQVDIVSGATYSSKVILKAINNALSDAAGR